MKLTRFALAAALAWGVYHGTANAQEAGIPADPASVSTNNYFYEPGAPASPSDQVVAPQPMGIATAACEDSCDDCCDSCCGLNWPCGCALEDLGEAWSIGDRCFFQERGWVAGGWLAQSYVWNPYNPVDKYNGPLTWTDRANEYQMNELYGYVGKAAATEGCGWDWGFRADAVYGTSYRWNTSGGLETYFTGNGKFYGLALPQLYGEIAYNDLTVKVGHFISPVGYYTVGTANNFFPIIPYTYQYGEPFTHTGALATYKVNDDLVVGGGVTHGWDASDNFGNNHAGGLITATKTIDEQRSLAYVGVFGPEPNFSGVNVNPRNNLGYTPRYFQTLVYSNKISDDVLFVLQSDYGQQDDAVAAGQTAKWYGLNSYLYWNMTCRCQWGLNGEWFRDQGGFRVGGVLPSLGSPNAQGLPLGRSGFDGSFYRMTFGPKYYFTPNMYTRVALVADWYSGPANANGILPFDDGTKKNQQAVVFDAVLTF